MFPWSVEKSVWEQFWAVLSSLLCSLSACLVNSILTFPSSYSFSHTPFASPSNLPVVYAFHPVSQLNSKEMELPHIKGKEQKEGEQKTFTDISMTGRNRMPFFESSAMYSVFEFEETEHTIHGTHRVCAEDFKWKQKKDTSRGYIGYISLLLLFIHASPDPWSEEVSGSLTAVYVQSWIAWIAWVCVTLSDCAAESELFEAVRYDVVRTWKSG